MIGLIREAVSRHEPEHLVVSWEREGNGYWLTATWTNSASGIAEEVSGYVGMEDGEAVKKFLADVEAKVG